jgi:hypothetical protein
VLPDASVSSMSRCTMRITRVPVVRDGDGEQTGCERRGRRAREAAEEFAAHAEVRLGVLTGLQAEGLCDARVEEDQVVQLRLRQQRAALAPAFRPRSRHLGRHLLLQRGGAQEVVEDPKRHGHGVAHGRPGHGDLVGGGLVGCPQALADDVRRSRQGFV